MHECTLQIPAIQPSSTFIIALSRVLLPPLPPLPCRFLSCRTFSSLDGPSFATVTFIHPATAWPAVIVPLHALVCRHRAPDLVTRHSCRQQLHCNPAIGLVALARLLQLRGLQDDTALSYHPESFPLAFRLSFVDAIRCLARRLRHSDSML